MKQIRASVFKARCLSVMDDIEATGEAVVVTKRGKPVVKVIPVKPEMTTFLDPWLPTSRSWGTLSLQLFRLSSGRSRGNDPARYARPSLA